MGFATQRKHTNKKFKDNFVNLASNSTQKGHLVNRERSAEDSQTVEGVLKYVIIDRIDTNGWIVEVGSGKDVTTYSCTNPQWTTTMPDATKTKTKYVPKVKTRVEVSLDKHDKIYTIMRVIGGKSFVSRYLDTLKISIDENNKTNQNVTAGITITQDNIELNGNNVTVNGSNLTEVQEAQANQIKILINENVLLKEKIANIEKQLEGEN